MIDKPSSSTSLPRAASSTSEVDVFLAKIGKLSTVQAAGGGRLIFGLDATASRQDTWDTACQLQAEMFQEVAATGSLSIQLVYYRGVGECKASSWISDPKRLAGLMERIECHAGETQIGKILAQAKRETQLLKVQALVFVGDAMEEEPDELIPSAGELGRLGVPVFMFQEGRDREVEGIFRQIAKLTKGAYCRFDTGAARQLATLLRAVAIYATGGIAALANHPAAKLLLQQMR